jgi:hypothetical protein
VRGWVLEVGYVQSLQFRAEFLKTFNHPQFSSIKDTDANDRAQNGGGLGNYYSFRKSTSGAAWVEVPVLEAKGAAFYCVVGEFQAGSRLLHLVDISTHSAYL